MRPPPALRVTAFGWMTLAQGLVMLTTPFWLPQPTVVALGACLVAAVLVAWWSAPRWLIDVRAEWLLPGRVHTREEVDALARITAEAGSTPAVELIAIDPWNAHFSPVTRLRTVSGDAVRHRWTLRFPQRGRVTLPPLILRSRLPFGLVEATCPAGDAIEVLVLPSVGQLRRQAKVRLRSFIQTHALAAERGDDQPDRLRDFMPGDARSRVHWRASARYGRLLVTERLSEGCRRLAIVVDTATAGGAGSMRLETLLAAAATVIVELDRAGFSLDLHLPAPANADASESGESMDRALHLAGEADRLLEALALAEPGTGDVRSLIPADRATLILGWKPLDLRAAQPPPIAVIGEEIAAFVELPWGLR